MPTYTTPYNLAKPLVADATDQDLWGGYLNDDMDIINDALVAASYSVVLAKTTTYVITTDDQNALITGDVTGAGFTMTLPAAATAGDGWKVTVKKIDGSSNSVTIDGNASETIDGATTYDISSQYQAATFCSNGTNWSVFSTVPGTTGPGIVPVALGGTGASTAAGARSNLGLGTMSTQDASAIAVTGGTMSGVAITGGSISGVTGIPVVTNTANGKIVIGAVTIQWGVTSAISGGGSPTVTFGTAFSGTPYAVTLGGNQTTQGILGYSSLSASGMTVNAANPFSGVVSYMVVGPT